MSLACEIWVKSTSQWDALNTIQIFVKFFCSQLLGKFIHRSLQPDDVMNTSLMNYSLLYREKTTYVEVLFFQKCNESENLISILHKLYVLGIMIAMLITRLWGS